MSLCVLIVVVSLFLLCKSLNAVVVSEMCLFFFVCVCIFCVFCVCVFLFVFMCLVLSMFVCVCVLGFVCVCAFAVACWFGCFPPKGVCV